jgi:phosphoribosyl 1,2-cyclic phosphate phosphodiesterase
VPIPTCGCKVCSEQLPRNCRLRTSALFSVDTTASVETAASLKTTAGLINILIDTSPDLRQQALRHQLQHLDGLLYTHEHADHTAGIDDLRGFFFTRPRPLPTFGSARTLSAIRERFAYIFKPSTTYKGGLLPMLDLQVSDEQSPFSLAGILVRPFPLIHGSEPVTGYRIGDIAYATDCNQIPAASQEIIKGSKTLVLGALRHEPHPTHFCIAEAVELAQALEIPRTILTHMTHLIDYDRDSAALPSGVELAYDGMLLEGEYRINSFQVS